MIGARLAKLSYREKAGIALATLAFFIVLLDHFVVGAVVEASRRFDQDAASELKRLAYSRAVLATEADVRSEYDGISGLLSRSSSPAEAVADLKGEIDEMARRTGLVLAAMEHREPKHAGAYDVYTVEIGKFESDMKSLIRFLYEVQNSAGLLRVSKLSLTPGTAADQVKGSVLITKVMLQAPASTPGPASE
jgi:hypothetical protein